jgi:hypothetical protein
MLSSFFFRAYLQDAANEDWRADSGGGRARAQLLFFVLRKLEKLELRQVHGCGSFVVYELLWNGRKLGVVGDDSRMANRLYRRRAADAFAT